MFQNDDYIRFYNQYRSTRRQLQSPINYAYLHTDGQKNWFPGHQKYLPIRQHELIFMNPLNIIPSKNQNYHNYRNMNGNLNFNGYTYKYRTSTNNNSSSSSPLKANNQNKLIEEPVFDDKDTQKLSEFANYLQAKCDAKGDRKEEFFKISLEKALNSLKGQNGDIIEFEKSRYLLDIISASRNEILLNSGELNKLVSWMSQLEIPAILNNILNYYLNSNEISETDKYDSIDRILKILIEFDCDSYNSNIKSNTFEIIYNILINDKQQQLMSVTSSHLYETINKYLVECFPTFDKTLISKPIERILDELKKFEKLMDLYHENNGFRAAYSKTLKTTANIQIININQEELPQGFNLTLKLEQIKKLCVEKPIRLLSKLSASDYTSEFAIDLLIATYYSMQFYGTSLEELEYIYNLHVLTLSMQNVLKNMLDSYISKSGDELNSVMKNISAIGSILINLIKDTNIANEIVKSGIVQTIFNMLANEELLSDEMLINNNISIEIYISITYILYSISKYSSCKHELIELKLVDKLTEQKKKMEKLIISSITDTTIHRLLKVDLVCAICYMLTDAQLQTLEISNNIITTLINLVNEVVQFSSTAAVHNNTTFYNCYTTENSIFYLEINRYIDCLRLISANDTIKQIIVEKKCLQSFIKILNEDKTQDIQLSCAQFLLTISFNEDIKNQMKSDESALKLIEAKSKTSEFLDVKSTCKKIVQVVNGTLDNRVKSLKEKPQPVTSTDQHIMISYCHRNKDNCMKLRDTLSSNGYKIWMDVDNAMTSLLQDMADAVERSSIVLICYSDAYYHSDNCRLELEYSIKLKKPIIPIRVEEHYDAVGWLGITIGQKFRLDFTKIENDHNQLFEQIDKLIAESHASKAQEKTGKESKPVKPITVENRSETIKKWTSVEIMNWLTMNKLTSLGEFLEGFDGAALLALSNIKKTNFAYFCQLIEQEISRKNLTLPLATRLRFMQLLDNL